MAENRQTPVAGQIYKHFKGNLYKVLAVAVHTESEEKLVVYQSVDNPDRVFARPLEMFMSDIDRFRYPLIRAKYRFTLVSEPEEETDEPLKRIVNPYGGIRMVYNELNAYGYKLDENVDKYFNEYRNSPFALTGKHGGYERMVHYEIIAGYCLPVYIDYIYI